ncbi:MAG: tyrosine-type recombinase/integrase [Acidobacteriaceae bacterium]
MTLNSARLKLPKRLRVMHICVSCGLAHGGGNALNLSNPVQRSIDANRRYLKLWIVPRWGRALISEMEPISIEDWLAELGRGHDKLANGTRLKIRNIMGVVFRHGIRPGFLPRDAQANPMKYVRQSGHSTREHTILTMAETMAILTYLKEPVKTMAWLDATTGLRVSELLALRWQDIDFDTGVLHVRRAIVSGVVGETKTNASSSGMPLAISVLNSLQAWRRETPYAASSDWVFASKDAWQEAVSRKHVGREPSAGCRGGSGCRGSSGLAYVPKIDFDLAYR